MKAKRTSKTKPLIDTKLPKIYTEIFDKLNENIVVCSTDRKIVFINNSAKKIIRTSNFSETQTILLDEFLSEDNLENIESIFDKIVNKSKGEILIDNKIKANKNLFEWTSLKFSRLEIEPGVLFVIISINDISEIKKLEFQIRDDEQRYKMMANLTTEGILIHNNGIVLDANQSLLRLLNTTIQEVKNKNIIELFSASEKDKQIIYNNISNKLENSYQVAAKLANKTRINLEIQPKNLFYKGKNLRVALVRNISEKKKEEKKNFALYKISEAVHDSGNLNELYSIIHKILSELIPVENFYIAIYDDVADRISFPFFVDKVDKAPLTQKPGKGLTEYVIRTGEPLLAPPDVFEGLEQSGEVESIGEPSIDWLGVPLKVGLKTIGVLAIQSYEERVRFGMEELNILQFVSTQIANAIERKRNETKLIESEEQIRLLLDSTAEAIYATDVNGICFMANQACAKILGYDSIDSFIKKNMHNLIHHSHRDGSSYPIESCEILLAVKTNSKLHRDEDVFWKSDGTPLEVEYWSHPIHKADKIIGAVVTFVDITDRIKAQQKIHEYNEELKNLNASKDKFFSVVAHDLRSPFHGLLGLSEIIVDEFDFLEKPDLKEYMANIHKTIENVYRLIENLLEWSRLQSGKMTFSPAKLNLYKSIETVQQVLIGVSSLKDITIINNTSKGIFVHADEKMLRSVLQNLITNGIKFSNPNSEITISAASDKEIVTVSVSDKGIGMDEDTLSKIFSLDHSITTPGTAQEKGTGLGLVLCHEMIEKHSGKIWAASKKGIGTDFHFTLPLINV
ncbi:MAG: PAS domain S-box protein [Ignavibacteriales bacterium]|nr:PAS domain S-box protein [Ignavibacteriales bacterium]